MKHRSGPEYRRVVAVAVTAGLAVLPAATAPAANAAIAYTVEPLGGTDTTPNLFGGAVCEVYECVKVPTPATVDWTHSEGVFGEDGSIAEGAANLNAALIEDPDEKLVFGFSQGAQVGGFWLRNYAPTTTVDPANTSFLFVGDPENTYGVPWAPRVPTDSGFAVTELWAQYDGWADWPDRFNLLAIANAVYGMLFVHPNVYDDMDLAAEEAAGNVVTWQANGITYKMVADDQVPLLDPLRNIGFGWLADVLNDGMRESIEAAYDRPATQEEADARYGPPPAEDADLTELSLSTVVAPATTLRSAAADDTASDDLTDSVADAADLEEPVGSADSATGDDLRTDPGSDDGEADEALDDTVEADEESASGSSEETAPTRRNGVRNQPTANEAAPETPDTDSGDTESDSGDQS